MSLLSASASERFPNPSFFLCSNASAELPTQPPSPARVPPPSSLQPPPPTYSNSAVADASAAACLRITAAATAALWRSSPCCPPFSAAPFGCRASLKPAGKGPGWTGSRQSRLPWAVTVRLPDGRQAAVLPQTLRPFSCTTCGESFRTPQGLAGHQTSRAHIARAAAAAGPGAMAPPPAVVRLPRQPFAVHEALAAAAAAAQAFQTPQQI